MPTYRPLSQELRRWGELESWGGITRQVASSALCSMVVAAAAGSRLHAMALRHR